MGDAPGSSQFSSGPSVIGRVRRSPATSAAAMVLFVVLVALWIGAAATARVWYHSAPSGYAFPSRSHFYVWIALGVVGALLVLSSLVHRMWPACQRWLLVVTTACCGAVADLVLVHLVTDHTMATAPLGYNNSGEGAVAIVALGVAQPVLVGALALVLGRLLPSVPPERVPRARQRLSWSDLGSLAGMVLACGAFAAWSLNNGTTLIVDTSLIAGRSAVTNVGAWWPGLFAAMATLAIVAVACTRDVISRGDGRSEPVPPQASERGQSSAVGT